MKIIIAGGSGFLGQVLIKYWRNAGHLITILSRVARPEEEGVKHVLWDAKNAGIWTTELDGADVVVNLVGKSVNCRYTPGNKAEIIRSRVDATLVLGKAIQQCTNPPRVWINAGSAAVFGNSGEEIKTEDSPVGEGFSPEVCKRWEKTFLESATPYTRKICLRIGVVFQPGIGLIKPFIYLVKAGLGGKIGSGNQYITWIHEEDFFHIVQEMIYNTRYKGIIHCCSPMPVTNKDFMLAMRRTYSIPFGLSNPSWMVYFGAYLIGTEGALVLEGRRVIPKILMENDFTFRHPEINETMMHLLRKASKL